MIGLMVTLSIGMVPLAFWMVKQELIRRSGENLASRAADIADKLDIVLSERLGDIQTIAHSPLLQERDHARIGAYLHDVKRVYPVYARISVADAEGRIMATTDQAPAGRIVREEAWFERTARGSRPDIVVVSPDHRSQGSLVALRFAARVESLHIGQAGVVWTEVDQETLRNLVARTMRRSQMSSLNPMIEEFRVLGSHGQVLLTSHAESGAQDSRPAVTDPAVAPFADGRIGYFEDTDGMTGQAMLSGYALMQGLPQDEATRWRILVRVDRRTVLGSTWYILWKLLGIGAAGLLPLLGLLFWARHRQAADERQVNAAREALEANEARIRTILDHALDAVISINSTGVVTEWNPQAEQTFGFTKQEALGRPLHQLIIPEGHREAHRRGLSTYINSGQHAILNRRIEINAAHKDGHEFQVELTVIPLRLGDQVSFCAFLRDITEQKRAQQELRDSKAFLGSIVENLPTMVFVKDAQDLRFVRVNKAAEDLIGVSKAELIGLSDYDLFPKAQADFFTSKDRAVLEGGRLEDIPEEPIQTKSKGARILHTKKLPILDGNARPQYLLGISEDITERKQAEDALRRSQHAAEAANKAKTEFLANVSHEIRTPLNAILGMLDMLYESVATPDQREYALVGRRAGRVLLHLVDDLLDMAKVEAGTLQLYHQTFNIREFLVKTQSMIRPRAHEKGLNLGLMVYDEVPTHIEGDVTRIQQVLLNLLGNAIKFTDHGQVDLSVSLVPAQDSKLRLLQFAVADTGIGIQPEEQERIFDRFTQIESGDDRKYGGTGLGLPISRQLAQLMGGMLKVESQLGHGSTFSFILPCRPAPPTQPPSGSASAATQASTAETTSASAVRFLRILVVDDFPETLQLVKAYLKHGPYDVEMVRRGEEAIERHQAVCYDLILMDMQMPGMDGYAVTSAIRASERTRGRAPVPVIAMTADVSDSARTRSTASGCTGFLGKPFTRALLLDIIQRYARGPQDDGVAQTSLPEGKGSTLDPDLQPLRRAFLHNRREDLHLLSTALKQSDFETIHTIGHRIKGLAGSYGLKEIGAIGAAIEQAADRRDRTAIDQQIHHLDELLTNHDHPEQVP